MHSRKMETPAAAVAGNEFKFYADREIAALLGVGRRTVHRWVDDGILPPPVHFGRQVVRWSHEDLLSAFRLLKKRDSRGSRRGRPSRDEEATAKKLGITVPELRAQRRGAA